MSAPPTLTATIVLPVKGSGRLGGGTDIADI